MKDSVLLCFSEGYNIAFHETEYMFREYAILLSSQYYVDILLFGTLNRGLLDEFKSIPYRNLFKLSSNTDQLIITPSFKKCMSINYASVIFNDNISNYNTDRNILSVLNYKTSFKVWHSPFFLHGCQNDNSLKNDDNIASLFDYNIFVSKFDADWCLTNKKETYNKDNIIILNNIITENVQSKDTPLKIIYYGRLSGDKCVNNFIKVILQLILDNYNIEFHIYGYESQYEVDKSIGTIDEIQKKTKYKITFRGYDKNIKHKLSQYDLCIIASYKETNSLCIQEAILAGVPIMSYNEVGILTNYDFIGNNMCYDKMYNEIKYACTDRNVLSKYIIDKNKFFDMLKSQNSNKNILELINSKNV